MNAIRRFVDNHRHPVVALVFVVATIAPAIFSPSVYAAGQLSSRKLVQSSQSLGGVSTDANGTAVAPGAGGNGAKASHTLTFTFGTSGATVNSLVLQYCTTPLLAATCTAPTGLDTSTVASAPTVSGFGGTAPTLDTTTVANSGGLFTTVPCSGSTPYRQDCILLKRTGAAANTGTPAITLSFGQGAGTDWIKNPTTAGTFYVRITAFSDAYTTIVDQGVVAGSANVNIDVTAKVQERLNFSVSSTASSPGGASCTALSGSGTINLGDANAVLDSSIAYDAHTYFRVNTNASGGVVVAYSGDTLKNAAGTNSITAASTTGASSTVASAQFGLAIDTSDTQSGNGYSFTSLAATSPYGGGAGTITNGGSATFAFNTASVTTPVQIASASAGTSVSCDTGSVRYIANIASTTKPGVYHTTIAYIATPTF